MKVIIVALTVVVMCHAFDFEEIPPHMKDRLDRIIAIKKQWREKWFSMTEAEKSQYEEVLLARMENLPNIYLTRIHDRIAELSDEHREKLVAFLRRRFPKQDPEQTFASDMEEIDSIFLSLPELMREKLAAKINSQFQEPAPYVADDIDSEMDFPDVPDLIELPDVQEAAAYSGHRQEELRNRVDEFLLKREDWKRKWEQLSDEKRALFESYINKHL
jgi:hypothetical protein